jgi:putative endonuclease
MSTFQTGILGEKLACRYLLKKRYEILETNIRLGKYAELDIVAKKDGIIHIVEVKAIQTKVIDISLIEFPIYNITPRKLRHLVMGAEMYLRNNKLTNYDYTLDAVTVVIDSDQAKSWVKYFPNIMEGL